MKTYAAYLAKRLLQFVLVVFIGINLTYVISHATPIDPVEQTISALTSFGNTSPEAIETMRESLRELYGMSGTPVEQYLSFWSRIVVGDFGPSLSAFPTPVSELILRALPWTIGLLVVAILGGLIIMTNIISSSARQSAINNDSCDAKRGGNCYLAAAQLIINFHISTPL